MHIDWGIYAHWVLFACHLFPEVCTWTMVRRDRCTGHHPRGKEAGHTDIILSQSNVTKRQTLVASLLNNDLGSIIKVTVASYVQLS